METRIRTGGPALLLLACTLLSGPAGAERPAAPGPGCMDARQVAELRQPSPGRVVLAQADGARFRLHFGADCPGVTGGDAALLAQDGWVCGTGNEYAQVGTTLCDITAVEAISAAEYASEVRASLRGPDGSTVLDTVTVRGERRRGFGGSPSFCLNPRWMRGWSQDGHGLRVEMRPRRAGGHRFYRVELAGACPELTNAPAIRLLSGPNIGLVCGNSGDRVLVHANAFRPFDPSGIERDAFHPTGTDRTVALSARHGCPIVAVYPETEEG